MAREGASLKRAQSIQLSERAGGGLRLLMKNFRFQLDGSLDGIGYEAVLLGFFQDPRRSSEILLRSDHDHRLDNDFGELVASAWHFFEFSGCD